MSRRQQFRYRGGLERWPVPTDLALGKVTVYLAGAAGGGPDHARTGGGSIVADVTIAPGDVVYVSCGQAGRQRLTAGVPTYGGGGAGGLGAGLSSAAGYDGGGASDLRIGGTGLSSRQLVAAGGGGCGGGVNRDLGGDGGATAGAGGSGENGGGPGGGDGGTGVAGGAGGPGGGAGLNDGHDGASGAGGAGGTPSPFHGDDSAGGGGGGGYFGGGGGGAQTLPFSGGGGGGGSNYAGGAAVLAGTVTGVRGANRYTGVTGGYGYGWIEYAVVPGKPIPATASPTFFDVAADFSVEWAFTSSDQSDAQTQLQVRHRSGTDTWTTETAAVSAVHAYLFPGHTFDALTGQTVEWQVRVQGGAGVWSAWSASAYIVPSVRPDAPTIDAGTDITSQTPPYTVTSDVAFSWLQLTVGTDVAGAYGVDVVVGAVLQLVPAVDTLSATFTSSTGGPLGLTPADTYHLRARVAVAPGVWSAWGDTGPLVANIAAPLAPTLSLTVHVDTASVVATVDNPTPDDFPAVANLLWRTVDDDPEQLLTSDLAPNGSYTDWECPFNTPVRYRVEAQSASGSVTSSE